MCLLVLFAVAASMFLKSSVLDTYGQRLIAVRIAEIQNQCTILSNQLAEADYFHATNNPGINAELALLSGIYNGRVIVIDDDFQIVKDTYSNQEGKTIVAEDVIECYSGQQISNYDEENRYIEIATPIKASDSTQVSGMILISVSTESLNINYDVMEKKAETASLVIIAVLAAVAVLASYLLVLPLGKMRRNIREIADGYGEKQLHIDNYSETREISEAFNQFQNQYQVIDNSREEFVANVSHELKTPLTSMKILADSLLSQPDAPVELYHEFMGDLSQEVERENKIINDLLALVKLDKTAITLEVKSQNVNDIVERMLKRVRPLAAKQNIELVFESFRPVTAEVDEVKLGLAITNLVENAIKYNRKNGWVRVILDADHKFFTLRIEDSGIGIPEEEREHIFERFYRVDKSHSREIGGTGLGLSIARNAIIMHRGSVKVESSSENGTVFVVKIPLTYIKREKGWKNEKKQ